MKDNRHLYTYNYFHQSKDFQLKPERIDALINVIKLYTFENLLDVGCGLGSIVNKSRSWGVEAYGVDFAPDLKKVWGRPYFVIGDARDLPFANNSFDLVVSSDFFEHVDEEDINKVTDEMRRVGKKIITFVADDTGKYLNARQRQLHVTHKPLSWWKEKLKGIDVYSSHEYDFV